MMKVLQEEEAKPNPVKRRINQLIQVQQKKEDVYHSAQLFQDKVKKMFDKGTKDDDFQVGDLVLRWDARSEDKGKHGKFDHLWVGPYKIVAFHGNNAYNLDGEEE